MQLFSEKYMKRNDASYGRRYVVLITAFLYILIYAHEVAAMSLITGEKVCLFSGFSGQITLNGEPAAGATIIRHVAWKDEAGESEETKTDKEGRFSFPTRWGTLRQFFPSQFVAHQNMHVNYEGKTYHIWEAGKLKEEEYAEFNGEAQTVNCELTDELESFDMGMGFGGTSCKWSTKQRLEDRR